jgi:NADH:ubiquinone oxidoreductase subunit H
MFLNIMLISESFSFLSIVTYQEIYWFVLLFFLLFGIITITFLLEVNRAPFDLSEAESELVAGYTVEYGGFFFGVYYLGEYLHLYFFSIVMSILYFGGWELPRFLWIIDITMYDFHIVYSQYPSEIIDTLLKFFFERSSSLNNFVDILLLKYELVWSEIHWKLDFFKLWFYYKYIL